MQERSDGVYSYLGAIIGSKSVHCMGDGGDGWWGCSCKRVKKRGHDMSGGEEKDQAVICKSTLW